MPDDTRSKKKINHSGDYLKWCFRTPTRISAVTLLEIYFLCVFVFLYDFNFINAKYMGVLRRHIYNTIPPLICLIANDSALQMSRIVGVNLC